MPNQKHVEDTISAFLSRIKDCTIPSVQWFPITEAQQERDLKQRSWAHATGIYLFHQRDELKYVGRALESTLLINRVFEQANAVGDPKWDEVIKDATTIIGVLPLMGNDAIWVPSLEVHLINAYKPKFNKRT